MQIKKSRITSKIVNLWSMQFDKKQRKYVLFVDNRTTYSVIILPMPIQVEVLASNTTFVSVIKLLIVVEACMFKFEALPYYSGIRCSYFLFVLFYATNYKDIT